MFRKAPKICKHGRMEKAFGLISLKIKQSVCLICRSTLNTVLLLLLYDF